MSLIRFIQNAKRTVETPLGNLDPMNYAINSAGDWAPAIGRGVKSAYNVGKDFVSGVGDLFSGKAGSDAAKEAAAIQASSEDKSRALQEKLYNEEVARQEPWRQAGIFALSDLQGNIKSGAYDMPTQSFNGEAPAEYQDNGFNFQADPGYEFRKAEALKGMQNSAAARGGLFSGATLSALANKSGQMASDEYQNAFNRYDTSRKFGYNTYADKLNQFNNNRNAFYTDQNNRRQGLNDRFSRLSTLAGFGTGANSSLANSSNSYGSNAGNTLIGAGNANASGVVGAANAKINGAYGAADLITKIYGAYMGGK